MPDDTAKSAVFAEWKYETSSKWIHPSYCFVLLGQVAGYMELLRR